MTFKYDVVTLIELVESKPCLWDKTNENHKNKIVREMSWMEICQFLDEGYDELSLAEKKKTGDIIATKWIHIRDAFLRSLKAKTGPGAKKRYIYHDHLKFLMQKDETSADNDSIEVEESPNALQLLTPQKPLEKTSQAHSSSPATSSERLSKPKRQLDSVDPPYNSRSDHELLLLSFLPYIRDMNESELMDMQMEVLTVIKGIKRRRIFEQQ